MANAPGKSAQSRRLARSALLSKVLSRKHGPAGTTPRVKFVIRERSVAAASPAAAAPQPLPTTEVKS